MKRISNKRAKALAISSKTKAIVYERDNGLCVVCGSYEGLPEAHYIRRSRGGLGIEKNIVTLCRRCHDNFDFGTISERQQLDDVIRQHLQSKYDDWNEEELYYDKYANQNLRGI